MGLLPVPPADGGAVVARAVGDTEAVPVGTGAAVNSSDWGPTGEVAMVGGPQATSKSNSTAVRAANPAFAQSPTATVTPFLGP